MYLRLHSRIQSAPHYIYNIYIFLVILVIR